MLQCRMHYHCIAMGSLHIYAFEDVSVDPYLPANRLRIEAGNETFKSMRIGLFMCARHQIMCYFCWRFLVIASYFPVSLINHPFCRKENTINLPISPALLLTYLDNPYGRIPKAQLERSLQKVHLSSICHWTFASCLGGGCTDLLFSPLPGEMIQFD